MPDRGKVWVPSSRASVLRGGSVCRIFTCPPRPLREGGTSGGEQLQGCTYKLIKLFDLCVRRPRREEGRERLADGCSSVATQRREEEAQQEITPEQAARPGIVVSQYQHAK